VPLRAPGFPPTTQADWDRWTRGTPVVPDPNSVTTVIVQDKAITNAKLRDSGPASVIGRVAPTPGPPADISASTDNTFLVRRAGALAFGLLADSDIPDTLARDTEVTAAIATFAALPDPFAQYLTNARGDARYQKLPLTASATYDPPSLAAGTGVTTTVGLTGAAMGNYVTVGFSLDLQGITVTGYVSTANTVAVRFQNGTAGTIDLASGTLNVRCES
jgi:hypothetical protein